MNPMAGRWAKLYADMTPSELAIEPAIASLGVPYRVQFPFFLFTNVNGLRCFPDFLLLEQRIVIEVDDDKHFTPSGIAKDRERTAKLEAAGYLVVRVRNEDAQAAPYESVDRCMEVLGCHHRCSVPGNYVYLPSRVPPDRILVGAQETPKSKSRK